MGRLISANSADATFLAAVDDLTKDLQVEASEDRRRWPRFPYHSNARIAFCPSDAIPSVNDFQVYQCHDLSSGGFAFVSPRSVEQSELVAVLKVKGDLIPLRARVVHQRETDTGHIVGCEFTNRLGTSMDEFSKPRPD